MPTDTYAEGATAYRGDHAGYVETPRYRDPGGIAFTWIAWALAFAFWALTMSSFFGILEALAAGEPVDAPQAVGGGGLGWLMMIAVLVVLGAAIAWGAARWATRDRRMDATTEAATADLYDSTQRDGGAVESGRS